MKPRTCVITGHSNPERRSIVFYRGLHLLLLSKSPLRVLALQRPDLLLSNAMVAIGIRMSERPDEGERLAHRRGDSC